MIEDKPLYNDEFNNDVEINYEEQTPATDDANNFITPEDNVYQNNEDNNIMKESNLGGNLNILKNPFLQNNNGLKQKQAFEDFQQQRVNAAILRNKEALYNNNPVFNKPTDNNPEQ